jgi:hypothetical protein
MKVHAIAVLSAVLCAALAVPAHAAAPAAPENVRKKRLNDEQVRITWLDSSSNEDGFEILRRPVTDPDFESRGTVGAGLTEFVDDAPRGTLFVYRVIAFNEDGDSKLSNECFVNRNPPPVPTYFNARLIALTIVRVRWQDRSNGERGFEIQRADLGKKFKTIARVPANTEVYDDETLDPANSYTYRMRALGRNGICIDDSKFSPERSVTTKGGVKLLEVELRGKGKGTVTSKPDGISCGPKDDHCVAEFPIATNVRLTAKPTAASAFSAWVDILKCENTKGDCTFNMGKDRVIGASFKKRN